MRKFICRNGFPYVVTLYIIFQIIVGRKRLRESVRRFPGNPLVAVDVPRAFEHHEQLLAVRIVGNRRDVARRGERYLFQRHNRQCYHICVSDNHKPGKPGKSAKPGEFVINPLIPESHLLRAARRELCRAAGVPWYTPRGVVRVSSHDDEWVRVDDVLKLVRGAVGNQDNRLGMDRISMALWLAEAEGRCQLLRQGVELPPLESGYARRLEVEVSRIAQLREPARTVAAVEFVQRVRDAMTVAEAVCSAEDREMDRIRDIKDQRWWWRARKMANGGADASANRAAAGGPNTDPHP